MTQNDKNFRAFPVKFKHRDELASLIENAKNEGKSVVFTNGCFDILHIGHVRYLQEARNLGDALVVAINTDDSIRKLKGPTRPVNKLEQRAELVCALECVDYVTFFDEDLPNDTLAIIKPSIHVKGGGYDDPDALPEAKVVKAYGGVVKTIPFTYTESEGYSTTDLINKINDK